MVGLYKPDKVNLSILVGLYEARLKVTYPATKLHVRQAEPLSPQCIIHLSSRQGLAELNSMQ